MSFLSALRRASKKRRRSRKSRYRSRNKTVYLEKLEDRVLLAATIFRINAGGNLVSATPNWETDSAATPSPYVNAGATGNQTFNPGTAIDLSDPSVPAGTPQAIFQSERWDPGDGAELQWDFPVTPGNYQVQLYFAETYLLRDPGNWTTRV